MDWKGVRWKSGTLYDSPSHAPVALFYGETMTQASVIPQTVIIDLLPASELDVAARRWQDLERQIGNTGLTNSWLWVKAWFEHYAETVQPTFAFGIQDGRCIGATLITRSRRGRLGIALPAIYLGTSEIGRASCRERV